MKFPVLLAVLMVLLLASFPPQASTGENGPPVVKEVHFTSWPEVVGEPIEGYVVVEDPDGDVVSVVLVFSLTGEWAEGVPEEQRTRVIEAESEGPGRTKFSFHASTDGWAPGAYNITVLARDAANHTTEYPYGELLELRLELGAPKRAFTWIYVGFGVLICLFAVMATAYSAAMRKEFRRPGVPVYYGAP